MRQPERRGAYLPVCLGRNLYRPAALEAYRDRLSDMPVTSLPDAVRSGEPLVAFPAGKLREQAVRTFVDTGRVPPPTEVG